MPQANRFLIRMPPASTAPTIPADKKRLYAHVEFLTSIQPPRSYDHVDSLERCAHYIRQQFDLCTSRTGFQEFKAEGKPYKNIWAKFGPEEGEKIIIGAHYDVAGHLPGADDNASGVAGVLELAHLLKALQPELRRPVELLAYCLEEPPFFGTRDMGSAVHARSMKAEKEKLCVMISLEMIGYFSDRTDVQNYPLPGMDRIYPKTADFISVVGRQEETELVRDMVTRMREASPLDVQYINAPPHVPGIRLSDHLNYWSQGFCALMITNTAFYRNQNYHTENDTIDTLDFDRMVEVVKGVYWTIVNL